MLVYGFKTLDLLFAMTCQGPEQNISLFSTVAETKLPFITGIEQHSYNKNALAFKPPFSTEFTGT